MPACPRVLSSCVLSIVLLSLLAAPPTFADPAGGSGWGGTESRQAFVSDTNHARVRHDRQSYQVSDHLTEVATRWAHWMARHHTLEHNPNLESEVHHWHSLGENVGCGSSEPPIHRAFMNDQYHRDNILSADYTQVGIGTARDDGGRLYVDEVFRRP